MSTLITSISITPEQKAWIAAQPRSFNFSKFVRTAMEELTDFTPKKEDRG